MTTLNSESELIEKENKETIKGCQKRSGDLFAAMLHLSQKRIVSKYEKGILNNAIEAQAKVNIILGMLVEDC